MRRTTVPSKLETGGTGSGAGDACGGPSLEFPPITNIFIGCSARRCSYVSNTSSLILDGYDNDVGESELLSDVYSVSELLSGQIRGVSLTGTRFSLLFVHVSSGGIS